MANRRPLTPDEEAEFAREMAARSEADRAVLRIFTAEHTGAWVTLGYVVLSLLGLIHQVMVLARFGINFAEYAQVTDFLLGAIRDPFVVAASVIPGALIYLAYQRFGDWSFARNPAKVLESRRKNPRLTNPLVMAGMQLTVGITWAITFQLMYANVVSSRIRRGEGAKVAISVSNAGTPARPFPTDSALIISVTSEYLFAYFPTAYETRVIPAGNLAYIGRRRVPRTLPALSPGWGETRPDSGGADTPAAR